MTLLLVTGTSTGVGKTIATAALAATARTEDRDVVVCKPAQTGVAASEPGDLATITDLGGVTRTVELARYPDSLAPETAARHSGQPLLTLEKTAAALDELDTADLIVVEGAGGLLVRLGDFTLLDLAVEMSAPVLVVAAAGLGTLNHAELTTRTLRSAGVPCAGLVIGSWPDTPEHAAETNRTDLPRITGAELVGVLPEGVAAWSADRFRAQAPTWFAPHWIERYLGG